MTTITITAETIAKLEAAGFNRWTKNGMDRLYVNADVLGLEVKVAKSGNAAGEGAWCGSEVCKQDANDILHSKVWIDVATGELHVVTDFAPYYSSDSTVEDAAIAYISSVLGTTEEEEGEEETEEETTDTTETTANEEEKKTMTTAAQRAANAKYDRANTRQISLKLNRRTDAALLAHLDAQPSIQGYIKRLIIDDMYAQAEDSIMEERIAALMAEGHATVSYGTDEPASAFFDVDDAVVADWLRRRFRATQTAITEGTWVVECGDGQMYDRIIMPMLDRLLADPLADAPRFSDMDEAVAYVETALGDSVADYDVESIAREVTDWVDGQLTLVRDGEDFWETVAEHDQSE